MENPMKANSDYLNQLAKLALRILDKEKFHKYALSYTCLKWVSSASLYCSFNTC